MIRALRWVIKDSATALPHSLPCYSYLVSTDAARASVGNSFKFTAFTEHCDPAFPKVDLHDWSTCRKTRTDLLASSDYFRATEIQKNYFCSQCTFLGFTLVLGVLVKLLEELIMRKDQQRELSQMVAILRRCLQQRNSCIIKSVRDLSSMNTLDA